MKVQLPRSWEKRLAYAFDVNGQLNHLPHFYELFSLWANPEGKEFLTEAAKAGREYLKKACHPVCLLATNAMASLAGT